MVRPVLGLLGLSPVVVLLLSTAAPAATNGRMSTYETPEGEIFFAARLESGIPLDASEGRDIVVLFDTSASQTGAYRDDALAALDKLLESLGPKDRVKLMAVDLGATALTDDFVAPGGMEMRMARQKLNARLPLGSTDMAAALAATADSFMFESGNPRAAVYIGDGISRAHVLTKADFTDLVKRLADRRISVSSYVIGPTRGIGFVAALVNQTGGMLIVDTTQKDAAVQAGINLSHWVHGSVAWPTSVSYSKGMTEVLPVSVPPLRSDRDSILIGKLADRGPQTIQMTVEVAGKPQDLKFEFTPQKPSPDVSFVPRLIDMVRDDGGVSLPTVGTVGLVEAGRMLLKGAENLSKLGRGALATGDLEGASRLAGEALKSDPTHPEALVLKEAAGRAGAGLGPASASGVGVGGDGALLGSVAKEGFFLTDVTNADQVLQQRLDVEVENGLKAARDKMGSDAEGAKEDLKMLLDRVEKAPWLDSDVRLRMRARIESAILEASRHAYTAAEQRRQLEETKAAALERERIAQAVIRKDEKIKQLTDRFNSLMDEGRYVEAEDQIATQVRELLPESPTAEAMVWWSRNRGNVIKMYQLREVRQRNFVDALFQVEKAHVPFPDEPPIIYPDPEVWEELTMRRKKYASVDLANRGKAEQRIFEALDQDTAFEFVETPLSDVVEYLKDLHKIEIQLDRRALDGVGIGSDTPITRSMNGISLRSALRLMLKDLDLTYVVKDEVLQITTPEEAETQLVTKVYPVGDLVVPVMSGMGMMGGMMGMMGGMGGMMGGMGGMMGGMGGMMGGMGGMGGMMGGMGGMGMGMGGFCGGFMNVADHPQIDSLKTTRQPLGRLHP